MDGRGFQRTISPPFIDVWCRTTAAWLGAQARRRPAEPGLAGAQGPWIMCQNLALMANCSDCCVLLLFCGRESLAYKVPYCQAGYFREWLQLLI